MDKDKRIKELLGKYYSGITTPEEFAELKQYFSGAEEVAPELAAERLIFNAFGAEPEIPSGLEEKLHAAIRDAEKRRKRIRFRFFSVGIAVAAVIALVFTLGLRVAPEAAPDMTAPPDRPQLLAKVVEKQEVPPVQVAAIANSPVQTKKTKSVRTKTLQQEDPTEALRAGEESLRLLSEVLNQALMSASDSKVNDQINEQIQNIDKTLNAALK